jgi:3-oxoacyl-[acyl-carrier-protein] synthase II
MAVSDVVVTGVGAITPFAATAAGSAAAWRAGHAVRRRRLPELAGTPLEEAEVAELPELDAADLIGRRMAKYMSEAAVLGCLAAGQACAEARLGERFPAEQIGLFSATGLAAANPRDVAPMVRASLDESGSFSCRLFGSHGLAATNPLLSFKLLANMPAACISILQHLRGPSYIFTPWEGQGGAALLEGWQAVASGEVAAALAGAADSAAAPSVFVYLRQAGLLAENEWPAHGAAYLVLERADTARRSGRPVYARLTSAELKPSADGPGDPLGPAMGRAFAAAPSILMAFMMHEVRDGYADRCEGAVSGVDRQTFRFALERFE